MAKTRNGEKLSNNGSPERQYFERAVALENERAELTADLKATWEAARRDPEMDATTLKALKRAVKLHIEDPQRQARRLQTEADAQELRERLGVLASTPLGEAAMGKRHGYDPETGEVHE
jgi:uncharacterized protein (UPF0335 family)